MAILIITRALQSMATCRQSPYLHKPAVIIMTSFSLWCHLHVSRRRLWCSQPLFSLWRHLLLSWPGPALRTYIMYVRTDTLPRLLYKDIHMFDHNYCVS